MGLYLSSPCRLRAPSRARRLNAHLTAFGSAFWSHQQKRLFVSLVPVSNVCLKGDLTAFGSAFWSHQQKRLFVSLVPVSNVCLKGGAVRQNLHDVAGRHRVTLNCHL